MKLPERKVIIICFAVALFLFSLMGIDIKKLMEHKMSDLLPPMTTSTPPIPTTLPHLFSQNNHRHAVFYQEASFASPSSSFVSSSMNNIMQSRNSYEPIQTWIP